MNEPKSKRNFFLLSLGLASSVAIGFLATVHVKEVLFHAPATASGSRYALTLNTPIGVHDDKGYVTSSDGTSLWFWFDKYDFNQTDRFITLETTGSFGNSSKIHSLKSVTISIDYGCVDVYRGYELENYSIEYSDTSAGYVVGDDAVDTITFEGGAPAYFKVVASAYTRIKSVVINYDCEEATTTDIELTVKAPSVTYGPTHKVADCNYLWFECNTTGEWNKQVMTRQNNGDWKISLNNVEVGTTYTCYLSLGPSATSSTGNYNAENNGFSFYVAEGQDKVTIASPTFGGQHEIQYTVHVSVNFIDDVPPTFGNMQFLSSLWDFTSGGNYHWGDYFTRDGNSFTASKTINSSNYDYYYQNNNYNLYWKPYIWDNAIKQDTFYNGSSGSNLVITPDGSSDIYVIIDAAYPTSSSSFSGTLTQYTNHQITSVYGDPVYLYPSDGGSIESFDSYDSNALRILEDGGIMGLKAGHTTYPVTVTTSNGNEETFYIYVDGDVYERDDEYDGVTYQYETYADSEGWFESHDVDAIPGLTSDFFNGVDISSSYALYQHGSKFYNKDGYEQSLFSILKENYVNYVRLRLWVDPQSSDKVLNYGGGSTNLSSVLWMAKEAKLFGLKLLLDFHYSDFWAHPGQQILPKSWSDCTSKEALCARIKSYTSETLSAFEEAGCLPDMVQLGNEISSGIYLTQYRGGDSEEVGTGDDLGKPSYLTNTSSYSYGTRNYVEYVDYIKAASEGVDAVDSSIKKVLHFGKGSDSSVSAVNSFFAAMPSSYYDYAALSVYAYEYFSSSSNMATFINGLSLSKPWFIAETAYPYTEKGFVYLSDTDDSLTQFVSHSKDGVQAGFLSDYPFTPIGQANFLHDFISDVYSKGGLGIFYWEPAWSVNKDVGWASTGSKNVQASMGLFSFQGKALGNLDIFSQLLGLA